MTDPCDPNQRVHIPKEEGVFKIKAQGPSWLVYKELIYIRCKCGIILGSPTNHVIQANGKIDASIVCSHESSGQAPCGWHVFGILDGWTYGFKDVGVTKSV